MTQNSITCQQAEDHAKVCGCVKTMDQMEGPYWYHEDFVNGLKKRIEEIEAEIKRLKEIK